MRITHTADPQRGNFCLLIGDADELGRISIKAEKDSYVHAPFVCYNKNWVRLTLREKICGELTKNKVLDKTDSLLNLLWSVITRLVRCGRGTEV